MQPQAQRHFNVGYVARELGVTDPFLGFLRALVEQKKGFEGIRPNKVKATGIKRTIACEVDGQKATE